LLDLETGKKEEIDLEVLFTYEWRDAEPSELENCIID